MSNAQEVVKRGYLTKSPPAKQALAKWKRRWCMLLDSHLVYPLAPRYVRLEYFDGEESQLAGKEPKGALFVAKLAVSFVFLTETRVSPIRCNRPEGLPVCKEHAQRQESKECV